MRVHEIISYCKDQRDNTYTRSKWYQMNYKRWDTVIYLIINDHIKAAILYSEKYAKNGLVWSWYRLVKMLKEYIK